MTRKNIKQVLKKVLTNKTIYAIMNYKLKQNK